jgi:hypothetical protein
VARSRDRSDCRCGSRRARCAAHPPTAGFAAAIRCAGPSPAVVRSPRPGTACSSARSGTPNSFPAGRTRRGRRRGDRPSAARRWRCSSNRTSPGGQRGRARTVADPRKCEPERVAIGQPVPRSEDPVLLRGEGITPTTLNLPGQALRARFVPFLAISTMRRFGPDAALEGVGFDPAVPIEQLGEICWDDRQSMTCSVDATKGRTHATKQRNLRSTLSRLSHSGCAGHQHVESSSAHNTTSSVNNLLTILLIFATFIDNCGPSESFM